MEPLSLCSQALLPPLGVPPMPAPLIPMTVKGFIWGEGGGASTIWGQGHGQGGGGGWVSAACGVCQEEPLRPPV